MMRTLFLQAPSFEGFDGGAGARYEMKREVKSFWFPTWLAQAAAMVPGSKIIDAPPHRLTFEDIEDDVKSHDFIVVHTSTPSFKSDVKTVGMIRAVNPTAKIGFILVNRRLIPSNAPVLPLDTDAVVLANGHDVLSGRVEVELEFKDGSVEAVWIIGQAVSIFETEIEI